MKIAPVNKRIYLGGLHSSITEDQIKERFSRFGTISHIHVARDSESKYYSAILFQYCILMLYFWF